MMFLGYTDPFATGSSGTDVQVSNFSGKLNEAFNSAFDQTRVENFFLTLESKATKLNTTLGQGLRNGVVEFQQEIYKVYEEGIQYGIAFEDAGKYLEGVQSSMGRMIPTSAEMTKNALVFGKAIGETPENVAKLIGGMTQYGITQSKSIAIMNKVAATAKASGVDAKVLTKTVSDNIQKAQIYGFKNGVEGLTKMAAQAQRVGLSLDTAQKTANLILNGGPEKAVQMASELQALGGNIGALGDPFQLIHMSMYDMEGLQDQIIKASSAAVDFNETTGEFKIGGEEMLRLRQQADILGLTYEDVAKGAINARKEQEIMSKGIDFGGLTEEQRGLVSSLAEIGPGGKVSIDLPGFEEGTRDLETLMQDNSFIEALNEYNKDLGKNEKDLQTEMLQNAKNQLSVQDKQLATLITIQNQGIFGQGLDVGKTILKAGEDKTLYGDAKGPLNDLIAQFNSSFNNVNEGIKETYDFQLATFTTFVATLKGLVDTTVAEIEQVLGGLSAPVPSPTIKVSDAFVPAGGGKMVTGSFGKFLGDTKDDMLLSPGIGDFFNKYNESENILKSIGGPKSGGDLSLLYKNATAQPSQNLVDLLTKSSSFSPTNTETTQKVEIGGKTEVTLNINTNIPQNLINEVLNTSQLKETIMSTVNTRLSAEYSDKLSNAFITQKRG
jgi:predicted regulator of amino acid metabolism with ACT domain